MSDDNLGKIIARGKKHAGAGEFQDALNCFDEALIIDKDIAELWYDKGYTLEQLNRYEDALYCFGKSLEIEPRASPMTWFHKGLCLGYLERHEEAIPCFDEAMKIGLVNDRVFFFKGLSQLLLRRNEEAIVSFARATGLEKKVPMLWNHLAEALLRNSQPKEAILAIEESLELDPLQHKTWKVFGEAYRLLGKNNLAIHCYDHALQLKPDDLEYLEKKVQVLILQKKYHGIIETSKRILELDPSNMSAFNNIGQAYARLGDAKESLLWYDRALEKNADYKASIYNKARAMIDLYRYEEALLCLDRLIIELGEADDPDILIEKGLALIELWRYNEALLCLEKCLSLSPDNPYAWLNKARALIGLKRPDEALAVADEALSRHPGRSIFWQVKGTAFVELQEHKKALDCFEQAATLGKLSGDALYHAALAQEGIGNHKQALKTILQIQSGLSSRKEVAELRERLQARVKEGA